MVYPRVFLFVHCVQHADKLINLWQDSLIPFTFCLSEKTKVKDFVERFVSRQAFLCLVVLCSLRGACASSDDKNYGSSDGALRWSCAGLMLTFPKLMEQKSTCLFFVFSVLFVDVSLLCPWSLVCSLRPFTFR